MTTTVSYVGMIANIIPPQICEKQNAVLQVLTNTTWNTAYLWTCGLKHVHSTVNTLEQVLTQEKL
jgi:conjugal transfer/entry exclusion protein